MKKRFLIIRLGAIGDIIHSLPIASAIKDFMPSAEIVWLVESIYAEILQGNPDIDQILTVDSKLLRKKINLNAISEFLCSLKELKSLSPDVAIDPPMNSYYNKDIYKVPLKTLTPSPTGYGIVTGKHDDKVKNQVLVSIDEENTKPILAIHNTNILTCADPSNPSLVAKTSGRSISMTCKGVYSINDGLIKATGNYPMIIKRDGTTEAARPEDMSGAHAPKANHRSVAICLIGGSQDDGTGWENNFTEEQFKSLKDKVEDIQGRYEIQYIIGHNEIDDRKECPAFDVSEWVDKNGLV